MELLVIDNIEAYEQTRRRLNHLLSEEGSANTAVALAEALVAGEGQEMNVMHLRAYAYTDAGLRLKNLALVEEGLQVWSKLGPYCSATISYNLASAQLHLWQLAVEQAGLGDAWLNKRIHLHEARRLFRGVAQDEDAEIDLRLKALTDCGNSFDIVGRYIDALGCYERALRLDSSFGMASGNRGVTLLNVASLMRGRKSHLLLQAAADLDTAINDRERVLLCGGQSALDTFERLRAGLSVSGDLQNHAHESSLQFGDPHLDWCLRNGLFLHISPDSIRAESKTLDSVSFVSFRLSLSDDAVLDRANEIIDAFNTIKQDYIAARYLVWLAAAEGSPIQEQARIITTRTSFWDTLNYADWGVRPGIGVQAFKVALDILDTIAVFVHLYLRSGRGVRSIDVRTLPYTSRSKKVLAPPLAEALKPPEHNKGLAALFDLSAELDEQSNSALGRLVQRRNAATHRFFAVHNEGVPYSSEWTEHVSWPELIEQSLESLRIARGAILYLAQMIHVHEKATDVPDTQGSLTMPMPFDRTDTHLAELG